MNLTKSMLSKMPEPIKILYEDEHIAAVIKPVNVPSEDMPGERGMVSLLGDGRKEIFLLHRLDKPVGGVMIFAKTKKAAAELSRDIAEHRFSKEYLAIGGGILEKKSGEMRDLLFKDSKKNRSYVVNRERKGVKEAILDYEVIAEKNGRSLVRVSLRTGRTHQIRVQMSHRKLPLCGDGKYGSREKCDISLYSCRISFVHPVSKEKMCFTSLPDDSLFPWSEFGSELNGIVTTE